MLWHGNNRQSLFEGVLHLWILGRPLSRPKEAGANSTH